MSGDFVLYKKPDRNISGSEDIGMFGTERIVIAFGELADAWKECIEELSEYGRMMANEYSPGIFIGKRIDCYYTESNTDGRGPSERHYHATYEYMVNGMKKKKRLLQESLSPPLSLRFIM